MNRNLKFKFLSIQGVSDEYKPSLENLNIAINDEPTDINIDKLFSEIIKTEDKIINVNGIKISVFIIEGYSLLQDCEIHRPDDGGSYIKLSNDINLSFYIKDTTYYLDKIIYPFIQIRDDKPLNVIKMYDTFNQISRLSNKTVDQIKKEDVIEESIDIDNENKHSDKIKKLTKDGFNIIPLIDDPLIMADYAEKGNQKYLVFNGDTMDAQSYEDAMNILESF